MSPAIVIIKFRIISRWIQFQRTCVLILLNRGIIRLITKAWFSLAYVSRRRISNFPGRRAILRLWRRRRACRSSTSTASRYSSHARKRTDKMSDSGWHKFGRCWRRVASWRRRRGRRGGEARMRKGMSARALPTSAKVSAIYRSVPRAKRIKPGSKLATDLDSSFNSGPINCSQCSRIITISSIMVLVSCHNKVRYSSHNSLISNSHWYKIILEWMGKYSHHFLNNSH